MTWVWGFIVAYPNYLLAHINLGDSIWPKKKEQQNSTQQTLCYVHWAWCFILQNSHAIISDKVKTIIYKIHENCEVNRMKNFNVFCCCCCCWRNSIAIYRKNSTHVVHDKWFKLSFSLSLSLCRSRAFFLTQCFASAEKRRHVSLMCKRYLVMCFNFFFSLHIEYKYHR